MSILSEDYRNNIWVVVAFIIIVVIYLYIISNNKVEDIKYEEDKLCGVFEFLHKSSRGGGRTIYILMLTSTKYGSIVYENINNNQHDFNSKIDYSIFRKGDKVCFLIKKPVNENKWNSKFKIIKTLKN